MLYYIETTLLTSNRIENRILQYLRIHTYSYFHLLFWVLNIKSTLEFSSAWLKHVHQFTSVLIDTSLTFLWGWRGMMDRMKARKKGLSDIKVSWWRFVDYDYDYDMRFVDYNWHICWLTMTDMRFDDWLWHEICWLWQQDRSAESNPTQRNGTL